MFDTNDTGLVLDTWENQISEYDYISYNFQRNYKLMFRISYRHVFPGALSYRRHHGKTKLTDIRDLNSVHVVLTTFHTVSAEWSSRGGSSSLLFSTKWKRVILDEGNFRFLPLAIQYISLLISCH